MNAASPSRAWSTEGTRRLIDAVSTLTDEALSQPTDLPGWSRAHVLAHVASNAEALCRLSHWAISGEETRMYASVEQRNQDIETGAKEPADKIRRTVIETAEALELAFDTMPEPAWAAEVVTIQGRTIAAAQLPWLRAREVYVHLVDIGAASFEQLPIEFCRALITDIVQRRSTQGGPALQLHAPDLNTSWQVEGIEPATAISLPAAQLAAWLAGRSKLTDLPPLPPWL